MTDSATEATGGTVDGGADSRTPGADEYARLRAKRMEREGETATAVVRDVRVGTDRVVLTLGFDWGAARELDYDLGDDRDVAKLEALAAARGFEFEQVGHLEDVDLDVVYAGDGWVPEAHLAHVEGRGSLVETFRAELRLLGRELARSPRFLRGLIRRVRRLTLLQTVVAVVLVKKLLVVALLAYLLL